MNGVKADSAAPSGSVVPIESAQEGQLAALVTALSEATNGLRRQTCECPNRQPLPSRDAVIGIVEALRTVLFPGYFGPSDLTDENLAFHIGSTLDRIRRDLREQLKRGICFDCKERDGLLRRPGGLGDAAFPGAASRRAAGAGDRCPGRLRRGPRGQQSG